MSAELDNQWGDRVTITGVNEMTALHPLFQKAMEDTADRIAASWLSGQGLPPRRRTLAERVGCWLIALGERLGGWSDAW